MDASPIQPVSDDVRDIECLLESFGAAVAEGDIDALASLMSEDVVAVFTGRKGSVRGCDPVKDIWASHVAMWRNVQIRRRDTYVRVHGDVAWASFCWDGKGEAGDTVYRVTGERWTAVLVWEQGGWRIAQTHSSLPFVDWEALRVVNGGAT